MRDSIEIKIDIPNRATSLELVLPECSDADDMRDIFRVMLTYMGYTNETIEKIINTES